MQRVEPARPCLLRTGLSDARKAGEPAYATFNVAPWRGVAPPPLRTPPRTALLKAFAVPARTIDPSCARRLGFRGDMNGVDIAIRLHLDEQVGSVVLDGYEVRIADVPGVVPENGEILPVEPDSTGHGIIRQENN